MDNFQFTKMKKKNFYGSTYTHAYLLFIDREIIYIAVTVLFMFNLFYGNFCGLTVAKMFHFELNLFLYVKKNTTKLFDLIIFFFVF